MIGSANLLKIGDGTVWVVQGDEGRHGNAVVSLRQVRDGVPIAPAFQAEYHTGYGCDAVVDSDGALWITWSESGAQEEGTIYLTRLANGEPGPRLQVSTHGHNMHPRVVPDEYGNVWVFWLHITETESRWYACRFGPRSGQAMAVCEGRDRHIMHVVNHEGVFTVLLAERLSTLYLVTGTEHGGFGEPVRV